MWPRIVEILLGMWLIAAPSFLPGLDRAALLSRALGAVVILLSGAACFDRLRRAYLGTFALSVGMVAWALFQPSPAPPDVQNVMITGLLLSMFAILPPDTMRPPREWRRFEEWRDRQDKP